MSVEGLTLALKSKEGKLHLLLMAVGIAVACIGGALTQSSTVLCDLVVIVGSVISMAGAEQFCRLIVHFQGES